jgi:hypothetical protein
VKIKFSKVPKVPKVPNAKTADVSTRFGDALGKFGLDCDEKTLSFIFKKLSIILKKLTLPQRGRISHSSEVYPTKMQQWTGRHTFFVLAAFCSLSNAKDSEQQVEGTLRLIINGSLTNLADATQPGRDCSLRSWKE